MRWQGAKPDRERERDSVHISQPMLKLIHVVPDRLVSAGAMVWHWYSLPSSGHPAGDT